ncbi:MAG: lysophospholipid acyltransferase family protein [Endomicrobiales bacterium]|nr:lysophospholipid acyltransferase family protein [Endomicrobiales bacterium]
MKAILRKLYYIAALLFSKAVLVLPYKLSVQIGALIGNVVFYFAVKARKITIENLEQSFRDKSKKEIRKIAKLVFENQGKNLFELFSFPKLTKERINSLVTIENLDAFKKALSCGNGVLLASAHCGNWEIMGAALALSGMPINVIAKKIYIPQLNSMLIGFRQSKGENVILRSADNAARQMLRALRNNESIAMLIDQDTAVPGVFVNFFNKLAYTPSGLATLAIKTNASVLLAIDERLSDDRHKVILEPIELKRTGNFDADVLNNTAHITQLIESHIARLPEQWVWMHERWKTKK